MLGRQIINLLNSNWYDRLTNELFRFKCRNCETVSCMDCGKDFWGDDYVQHNKCISEQEKYQGTPTDYKGTTQSRTEFAVGIKRAESNGKI